jgi:hypothetical protein
MIHTFTSQIELVGHVPALATAEEIEGETMLFSASPAFAFEKGGPLTRAFLEGAGPALGDMALFCASHRMHIVIDTRSHMLMRGFSPAIGGWHCDAYPRPPEGQPDLTKGTPGMHHITAFCSTHPVEGVSRTSYLSNGYSVDVDVNPDRVWSSVNASS